MDRSFLQDSPTLVTAVSSQPANTCDPAELGTQLAAHVKVLDFPDARSHLIDLLVTHRQALTLLSEPLAVTDHVTHHIDLKTGTCRAHVPSY